MARIPLTVWVGVLAGVVWLASGALFAAIVWLSLLDSDAIRLIVPQTIPVTLWHVAPLATVLIVAASSVAMAAAAVFAARWVLSAAGGARRSVVFVAMWFAVIVIAGCLGLLDGVAQVIGNWPPPRLAFLAQGIPDAIAPTLYGGLVLGWIPGLLLARSRVAPTAATAGKLPIPIVIAVVAAVVLVATSAVAIGASRSQGLAGQLPPAVQQPQPTAAPTGTAPAETVPAAGPIDPSWCTAQQLTVVNGGGDAATGHRQAQMRATNTSPTGCVLNGYPDVAFADTHGSEIAAVVVQGSSFMATDPGPAPVTLAPGASATAQLGWDATDGRTTIGAVWIAPYQGIARSVLPADFDITSATRVAVTAWVPDDGTVG